MEATFNVGGKQNRKERLRRNSRYISSHRIVERAPAIKALPSKNTKNSTPKADALHTKTSREIPNPGLSEGKVLASKL